MLRGLEGEELLKSVRELVTSWAPIIRDAGSLDQAEDTLLHLEENDENFHRHEFIKVLKRRLEETLSPVIEEELDKHSTTGHIDSGRQETLVSSITDHILSSEHYTELEGRLKVNVEESVRKLLSNFDTEFTNGRLMTNGDEDDPLKTPLPTDDEEGSVMIFNQDQLKTIANNLGKTQNFTAQKEAMQKLNQIISGEIVQNKHWSLLRKNLLVVMADGNEELLEQSLKFVAKSFTSTSHHTSHIYILLMDFLNGQFSDESSRVPKRSIKDGLNCSDSYLVKILKAFRLMIEFQQEAPSYWVRYPLSYLEEIVESSLRLLSQGLNPTSPGSKLTPLHFVSILDPKAQWFIKWMHGNYCRQELLKHLKKYDILISTFVQYCMEFSSSKKSSSDQIHDLSASVSRVNLGDSRQRTNYTMQELEYALFVHSLHFLSRLLSFRNGRSFFPVTIHTLEAGQSAVTIPELLKALVLLLVDNNLPNLGHRSEKTVFGFNHVVAEVLKSVCTTEDVCSICVCHDLITDTLLKPVTALLDETNKKPGPSDSTLLYVADILCVLATNPTGRRHLLYGENKSMFSRTRTSPAHTIAEFTRKALSGSLSKSGGTPSNTVIGAYLYICRQIYNTCEGLLVLSQYELHDCVAKLWKKQLSDKSSRSTSHSMRLDDGDKHLDSFKATLQDNLLNFASTTKGVLLLQQTGTFAECVKYMYSRYDKKLQVSKCEKFGYGYMVTQVSATAPGVQALQKSGYIKAMLGELWAVLETGNPDIISPKSWPVDPIERIALKHFVRLVSIVSSFPAVYELLRGEALPTKANYSKEDIPETIMALLDRLVIIDTEPKIHSLFNYEHSYTFGLRFLSIMAACLDTYLLLQSQYKFQEFLLKEQSNNTTEDGGQVIVDGLSMERNYILVKTFLPGGPTERLLPPRSLDQQEKSKRGPLLFSSYPVPREYQPNVAGRSAMKQENDLMKFLSMTRPEKKPEVWIEKCQNLLSKMLLTNPDHAKGNILQQILELSVSRLSKIPTETKFPLFDISESESNIKKFKLSPLQLLGIKTVIKYGIHLKLINTSSECTENLTQLLRLTGSFLKQQQKTVKTSLRFLEGSYPGFDWFTATVFLIFSGNLQRSWSFLHKFSAIGSSAYLWLPRLHSSQHLTGSFLSSGIPVLCSSTAHNIELILQVELPLIASAFKMSGYTPSQMCLHWLSQCFWNYLDWLDIVHYMVVCIVFGIDYQVYVCIAILKHLQKNILSHMQTQDLVLFLKEEPIYGFHIVESIKYMKELEKKYRKTVLQDMLNINKP